MLTAEAILKKIARGRLTGDEEISPVDREDWVKLASHPAFYDALLKRLYADQYQGMAGQGGGESPAAGGGEQGTRQATRQGDAAGAPGDGEDGPNTRQIGDVKEGAATIQQALIDELFKDTHAGEHPAGEPESDDPAGTTVARIPSPGEPALGEPIEPAEPAGPSEMLPPSARGEPGEIELRERSARRRKMAWIGLAICVLVLLFQFGVRGGRKTVRTVGEAGKDRAFKPVLDSPAVREKKIISLMREAEGLAAGDSPPFYRGAYEVLEEARAYDEANADALGRLAEVGARIPDPANVARVEQYIQRGRVADPHFSQFYRAEAILALRKGDLDLASRKIAAAYEADPTNGDNAVVNAEIKLRAGDLGGARTDLEEAIKYAPALVRAHYLYAAIAVKQSDLAGARTQALEALKLNPLHSPSYLVLADVASAQGNLGEARGLYETSGRLAAFGDRGSAAKAFLRLGEILEASGNRDEALNSYRLAYYYEPASSGSLTEKTKGLDLADSSLKKLADATSYGEDYFLEQAEGLMGQGKHNEAVRFYQAAYLLAPENGEIAVRLGETLEKLATSYDDFRQIMNLYERAIERSPTLGRAYMRLGILETEQYNWDRGRKLLMQAQALMPKDADVYVALGKHYYKRQDYNEALNQFVEAKKYNPNDSEIPYYAGLLRLVVPRDAVRDAAPFFEQAYKLNPQNYDALVEWMKLRVLNYEKNFAIKFVNNLIAAEPDNANYHWVLGEIYATNGEHRRAILAHHKALDIDNRNSKVRMSLAASQQAIGESERAIAEYRTASIIDRRNSNGYFKAADLLFQLKNFTRAEEMLRDLIAVSPNYPGAQRYLSRIFAARKQRDLAIEAMQKEVSNNPENVKFILELAELYMDYEKYEEAVNELKRVTNLAPLAAAPEFRNEKIRAYLLLSRCYRALLKPESAEASIRLALDLDANDPELHREMGYVYYDLQRDKEGVKAFEFYLNRNPAARDAEQIRRLIQRMVIEE